MTGATDETGWAALLDGPKPGSDKLKLVLLNAAQDPDLHLVAMGLTASWLAAAIATRGLDECRAFAQALEPAFDTCANLIALFPLAKPHSWKLDMLSLAAVAETLGVTLNPADIDVDAMLAEILAGKKNQVDPEEKLAAVLISLARGRHECLARLPKHQVFVHRVAKALKAPSGAPPLATAFDAYVRGFPAQLAAGKVEWRTLTLVARLALADLGTVAVSDVAATLATRIRAAR